MSVSDPTSPKYGQFLSNTEVHELLAPSQQTTDAIHTWLNSNGITATPATPNSDFLVADVTVAQAESLLATEYCPHHARTHYLLRT
jgi:tripeptidyl-peptidase-1